MVKRVFIVHGWAGNPENCWFPWLKEKLEGEGFKVEIPEMPNSEEPEINSWVSKLKEIVNEVDKETFFVGHSIGCQTIMRYLETLSEDKKIGGVVFVAGFFNLPNLETEEEKEIAKPWLETPIDTDKVKLIGRKFVAVFSDNDPDVPLSDSNLFEKKFGAKIIVEEGKGHFSDVAGVVELPIVVTVLLGMAND